MMKNIVFLDFDGPMFPNRCLFLEENQNTQGKKVCEELNLHPFFTYWKMDPIAVAMLHRLNNITPFDLVISSSWSGFHDKNTLEKLLLKNNFELTLHHDWKSFLPEKNRLEEIKAWLTRNQVDNYLIIDDLGSGRPLENQNEVQNVFLVDEDNGISTEDYLRMTKIVSQW